MIRTPVPGWLKEKCKEWGEEWEKKYNATHKSSNFRWRQYQNNGYKELLKDLSSITNGHCSFCDAFPMGARVPATIEHFKPKTLFPLTAYMWDNLFLCCGNCQKKGEKFNNKLLKPDEDYYSFDEFFLIEWDTGKLIPNKSKSLEKQKSAKITIDLYRLNEDGKPEDRLMELQHFLNDGNKNINEWAYRFFLERGAIT